MNAEFYRYNQVFEYSINYPIELYREMRFERDVPFIRLSVFDEKILVAAQKDLTLLDFDSGELQWERKTESYIGSPVCIDKDHIYTTVDDAPGCLDANTGEIIWRIDRKELAIG